MRKGFFKLLTTAGLAVALSLGIGTSAFAGGAYAEDSSGYDDEIGSYYSYWWNEETEETEKTDWEWDWDWNHNSDHGVWTSSGASIYKNTKTGAQLKNGWYLVDEEPTYFDADGYAYEGFLDGQDSKDAGWSLAAKDVYTKDMSDISWEERLKMEKAKYHWITDSKGTRYGATGYYYDEDAGTSNGIAYGTYYLTGTPSYIKKDKNYETIQIDGKYYKFNADGYISKNEWFDDGWMGNDSKSQNWKSEWKYATSDGSLAEGWTEIDGSWYYFYKPSHVMATDAVIDGYRIDENGTITSETGWYNDWFWTDEEKGEWADRWLYIQPDGKVSTGWTEVDGSWYYFSEISGVMFTDTVQDYYYLTKDGTLATGGWYYNWYWTDEEKGEWDDEWIYTYSDGSVPSGWTEIDGTWYYFVTDKGTWTLEDETYTFWYSYMATDAFVDGYYINSSGTIEDGITGAWYQDDKGWYFMDSNGWYPSDTSYIIDNKYYYFNEEGYMIDPPEENSTEGQG